MVFIPEHNCHLVTIQHNASTITFRPNNWTWESARDDEPSASGVCVCVCDGHVGRLSKDEKKSNWFATTQHDSFPYQTYIDILSYNNDLRVVLNKSTCYLVILKSTWNGNDDDKRTFDETEVISSFN